MLVRVGLVEEEHRGGASVEEGEQGQDLMEAAPGRCDVESVAGRATRRLSVLHSNEGVCTRRVIRWQQFNLEDRGYIFREPPPSCRVARDLQQQVAEDVPRLALPNQEVLVTGIVEGFVRADAGKRRHMDNLHLGGPKRRVGHRCANRVDQLDVHLLTAVYRIVTPSSHVSPWESVPEAVTRTSFGSPALTPGRSARLYVVSRFHHRRFMSRRDGREVTPGNGDPGALACPRSLGAALLDPTLNRESPDRDGLK